MISTQMRRLDYDDLLILRGLLRGVTAGGCAKLIGVTQPAVSQRMRKMEQILGTSVIYHRSYYPQKDLPAKLSKIGRMLAVAADQVLTILEGVYIDIYQERTKAQLEGIDER